MTYQVIAVGSNKSPIAHRPSPIANRPKTIAKNEQDLHNWNIFTNFAAINKRTNE